MKKNYFIEPDLEPIFAKVLDRLFICKTRQKPTFTDFYDPAKWTAFYNALKNEDAQIKTFGGTADCERRMLGFFPLDYKMEFPISRLQIKHNSKFNKAPRHQDYLGAILGLGFDRSRIGDIFLGEEYSEIFVHRDISEYLCEQLDQVGRTPVTVRILNEDEPGLAKAEEVEGQLNLASMRLDVVVAAAFNMSRGKVVPLIRGEKVFVNWMPCVDTSKQVKPGDMITLRGYGRVRIGEVRGKTKKDRLRVAVFRNKSNGL